jgi:hypothetical protein
MPPVKSKDAIHGRAARRLRPPRECGTCRVWSVPGKSPEAKPKRATLPWTVSMKQEAPEGKPLGALGLHAGVHVRC